MTSAEKLLNLILELRVAEPENPFLIKIERRTRAEIREKNRRLFRGHKYIYIPAHSKKYPEKEYEVIYIHGHVHHGQKSLVLVPAMGVQIYAMNARLFNLDGSSPFDK